MEIKNVWLASTYSLCQNYDTLHLGLVLNIQVTSDVRENVSVSLPLSATPPPPVLRVAWMPLGAECRQCLFFFLFRDLPSFALLLSSSQFLPCALLMPSSQKPTGCRSGGGGCSGYPVVAALSRTETEPEWVCRVANSQHDLIAF